MLTDFALPAMNGEAMSGTWHLKVVDDAGSDIVLGDNGTAVFLRAFVLDTIESKAEFGGNDIITTGNGPDVVLGGSSSDIVLAAAGDAAAIEFLNLLDIEYEITPALGADLIATGAGDDARDVVLGDSGKVEFFDDALNTPSRIETTEHGTGDMITVAAMRDDEHEADTVVMKLLAHKFEHRTRFLDYAILYRGNHQSRLLEEKLREHKVPYTVSGGQSFFDKAEIKDLVAYLRLIANEDDDPAFIRDASVALA